MSKHLYSTIWTSLDVYLKYYDNLFILGDLNSELKDNCLNGFPNVSNLKSLSKKRSCFENPDNRSCIELLLTNRSRNFQNTSTIVTGISDFHKLVATVLKMLFKQNRKLFNTETIKFLTSNYLELNWTMNWQKLI